MGDNTNIQNSAPMSQEASSTTPANSPAPQGESLGLNVSTSVREVIGNSAAEQSSGGAAASRQQVITKTPQERKAELLARLPKDQDRAERYMKRQVTQTLEKQLEELESELSHTSDFYQMNVVMAKIRHYRDIVAELIHVTFEQLKSLWLQFVHNLTI